MGCSHNTMVRGLACVAHGCRSVLLGTPQRYHAMGVWNSRMQRLVATVGTLRRNHPSGRIEAAAQLGRSGDTMVCGLACTRVLVSAARDALRYHAVGVQVVRGQYRTGLRRSGRFGDTYRLGRCVPGGWVGHFALMKCYTCLRGVRLFTFGHQWV